MNKSDPRKHLGVEVGDFVVLTRDVIKGAFTLPAGTILKVAANGRMLHLMGEACKMCGVKVTVSGVARYDCEKTFKKEID